MKKKCISCELWLPLSEFGPDNKAPDKHKYDCRACYNKKQREYRNRNKTIYATPRWGTSDNVNYKTANCEVCLSVFYPKMISHKRCAQCVYISGRVYSSLCRVGNRSKRILNMNDNKSCITVPVKTIIEVTRNHISATNCCYCGREFSQTLTKTIDHKIPICFGGKPETDNISICCRDCNLSKGGLQLSNWIELCNLIIRNNI